MLLHRLTRLGTAWTATTRSSIRPYHDAKAILFNPDHKAGPVTKEVDIKIGDPHEAYVMFSPEIGCLLAGRPLLEGSTIEVPLTYFHNTKHFARGSTPDLPRLILPTDLYRPTTSDTTTATLFHFGLLSTIALNGTGCEAFTRLMSTTKSEIGRTLEQLKDM